MNLLHFSFPHLDAPFSHELLFHTGLDATFRPIWDAVLNFRLRAVFRRAADDVVGPADGAGAVPQTHDDGTSPTPVLSSELRAPTQGVELDALSSPSQCASSASNDNGPALPSSA